MDATQGTTLRRARKRIDWWEFRHRWKWRLYDVVTTPRRMYRRVAHIASFLPLLWKDNDFDHAYLVDLVIFKLSRMADHFERHHNHSDWKRQVRDIRIAIGHLERHKNPEKYGPRSPDEPFNAYWTANKETGLSQFKSTKALQRWGKRYDIIERENWDAAWELIRRKARGWWD